jgi:Tol biopolymer transport system component
MRRARIRLAAVLAAAGLLAPAVVGPADGALRESLDSGADSKLAFTRYVSEQAPELMFVVRSDGSALHQLPIVNGNHPAWSHDGRFIAFDAVGGRGGIYVSEADGKDERAIVTADVYGYPRWSPDGKRIAFNPSDYKPGLTLVNTNGTGRRVVRIGLEADLPDWSPDGRRVAFTGNWGADPSPIYVVNLDGSGLRRITQPLKGVNDFNVRWSPDGKTLLFIREGVLSARGQYENRIYVVSSNGGGLRLIMARPSITSVSWSPDGLEIAYAGGASTCCEIHIFDLARRTDRVLNLKVCKRPATCQHLDWQRARP